MYCQSEGRTSRWLTVLGAVAALSMPARPGDFVPGGPCTRGRVTNNGVTIVTDWGTPLRGGSWCGDCHLKDLSLWQDFRALKSCGLNAMHVYLEKNDDKPVGYEAEHCDSMVEWCRQESLYIMITFGMSALPSYGKVDEFWRFYAPRYADQTHVIYEAKNEPEDVVVNSINWYQIIREGAPDTHILFGSYSNLAGSAEYALRDIRAIGDKIDWGNSSIAMHGYVSPGDFQEQVIRDLNAAGYAVTNTEFPDGAGLARAYENAGISYFHFRPLYERFETLCNLVRSYGLSWEPDFGDWPQPHVERPVVVAAWGQRAHPIDPAREAAYRLVPSLCARGSIETVYDLWGREVWRASGPAGACRTNGYAGPGALNCASQMCIVKYRGDDY